MNGRKVLEALGYEHVDGNPYKYRRGTKRIDFRPDYYKVLIFDERRNHIQSLTLAEIRAVELILIEMRIEDRLLKEAIN